MSDGPDLLTVALGVLGLWLGVVALGVVVWVGAAELLRAVARRRERRVLDRRVPGRARVEEWDAVWEWPRA